MTLLDRRWLLVAGITLAGLIGALLALWLATPVAPARPIAVDLPVAAGRPPVVPPEARVSKPPRVPVATAERPPAPEVPLPSAGDAEEEGELPRKVIPPEHDPSVPWPANVAGIRGAIRDRMPELEDCYRDYLGQHPGTAGRVVANFSITGGPEDAQARIRDVSFPEVGVDPGLLERCVSIAVEDLRFEPPEDGRLDISYPLVFSID